MSIVRIDTRAKIVIYLYYTYYMPVGAYPKGEFMKKAIKICMLLLVMMLSFSFIAISVSASTCEGTQEVNVALDATITGDRGPSYPIEVAEDWIGEMSDGYMFWGVWDHFHLVNDGNVNTLCPATTHNAHELGIRVTFDGPYNLSKVVIYPYGGEGRTDTSHKWEVAGGAMAKENGYQMKVYFYAGDGSEIIMKTYTAEKEKIEIDTADFGEVCQIYIFIQDYQLAQGIWEVEAWTKDTHKWQVKDVIEAPTCSAEGTNAVKCSTCGETADAIATPTGHRDNCSGSCANGCGLAVKVEHLKDATKPCSGLCAKCNTVQFEGQGHIADGSNPCSNTCVVCGQDVVPNAYDIEKIWSTSTYKPYTYAKHVANPEDPCDTTCYSCKKPNTVKAVHVPDPTNPCGVSKCYKCQLDGVFSSTNYGGNDNNPHYRAEGTCGRTCGKCSTGFKLAFTHEFVDEQGNPYCGGTCAHCGGTWIEEQPHTFTAQSPNVCVDCNWNRVAQCEHTYTNSCDNKCNTCNATRYGLRSGGYPDEYWHVYTNSCDTTCNDCNAERTITHKYTYDCQQRCGVCGELTRPEATQSHVYSNVKNSAGNEILGTKDTCDSTCDVCSEVRDVPHSFKYVCSPICVLCQASNPTPHTYENDCDNKCDVCGLTRNTSHTYDNACDATCNVCGVTRTKETDSKFDPDHDYENACDATCNICGITRTKDTDPTFDPDHDYENACDASCNICGTTREVPDHVYDNACDTTCNVCNNIREVPAHTYDNDCDSTCNTCNVKTRETSHDFGIWLTIKDATKKEAGEEKRFCNKCQFPEVREIPKLGGMGTGAVVGIVSGSVVVAGGGGFCLWWFVLKKKFIK